MSSMKKKRSSKQATSQSRSERRQIENEVVFRKANEKVQEGLQKLEAMAKAEGVHSIIPDKDMPLHFYCECSDENCRERIVLSLSKYEKLHKDRSRFIVLPNHETAAIEDVVYEQSKYAVVDKKETPPEDASILKRTSVNNAS